MPDPVSDLTASTAASPAVAPGFVFTDAQFQALLAAAKGHSAASVVVADVAAVNADVIARLKTLIADAEGAAGGVHGAAKAVQADVKANWPILLVGLIASAALVLHVLSLVGFKL